MTQFDATEYFNRRAQEIAAEDALNPVNDRLDALKKASELKQQLLGAQVTEAKRRALANAGSVVNKLGLEPDGLAGQAVNLGVSAFSGATRDTANILAAPLDIAAAADDQNLSQEHVDAIARFKQGTASPEDIALINTPTTSQQVATALQGFNLGGAAPMETVQGRTPLQIYDQSVKAREVSRAIHTGGDYSSSVHQGRRDALTDQLGANFEGAWDQTVEGAKAAGKGDLSGSKDLAIGLAKLLYNAGDAAVGNPGAVAEYVAENAPQLFVGALGSAGKAAMTASNIGYASDYYTQGVLKHQAENGGALPSPERRQEMALMAAGMALAEHAGDTAQLAAVMKGAKATATDLAKTGVIQAGKNTLKALATGVATEAPTEGYQSVLEKSITGEIATPKEVYESTVIGGLAGGGMTGGGRAVAELTKATPEHDQNRQVHQTAQEAQEAAIATGDVTALLAVTDPKKKGYSPSKAVAALAGNAALETTDADTKQANLKQAGEITAKLQEEFAIYGEGGVDGLKQELKVAQRTGNKELAKTLTESIVDAAKVKLELDRALGILQDFHQDLHAEDVDVPTAVAAIKTGDTAAAASLINLSMAIPERLDTNVADGLANDTSNALSTSQRDYLRSFAAARVAEKRMDEVSREVLNGSKSNVGLVQYRNNVTAALAAGNQGLADKHLASLEKFAAAHVSKADAVTAAWKRGKGTQVVKTSAGHWQVATTLRPYAEVQRAGGLTVNSPTLMNNIRAESNAINAAITELKAARALKSTGANDVSNRPQPHVPAQDAGVVDPQASAAGSAAQTGPTRDAGLAATGTTSGVEVAGLTRAETQQTAVDSGVSDALTTTQSTQSKTQSVVSTREESKGATGTPKSSSPSLEGATTSQSASQPSSEPAEQASGQLQEVNSFTQSASKEADVTQRPLVAVKDFLSTGWSKVKEFSGHVQLSDAQQRTLDRFSALAKQWSPKIKKTLARKSSPDFYYEDMMQYLIQDTAEGLDVDENLKTAIAYAAFAWVAENATRPAVNSNEEINAILLRDENAPVSDDERRALGMVGVRENVVRNGLGQKVMQALGMTANKDAHQDLGPRMESALGARVLALLVQEGIVERETLTGAQMGNLAGATYPENAQYHFVKLARDSKFQLGEIAQSIFEANKGSQSILDKLFGVESGLKDPSFTAGEFKAQKGIRNTRQKVPAELAKIIEHENKQPNHLRQDMWHLVEGMEPNLLLQIAGYETLNEKTTHKANRLSHQAKNDGLVRELENFVDFVKGAWVDKGLDEPIYLEHAVWKQQRVGIATNTVNPQASKIHRHMLYRPDWATTIDPSNKEQLDNFKLRVLEGLGVKTDKQANTKSLAKWDEKVAGNPVIQAAIAALRHRQEGGELKTEQQLAIVAGVKEGGEDMHSLDALMALAQMSDKPFTVHLMGEVDGVTNGPMLTHLLLGAASSVQSLFGLLNKGGFYEQGNEASNYNVWRGMAGHTDLYETTARSMNKEVQVVIFEGLMAKRRVELQPIFNALFTFTGTLVDTDGTVQKAGRNIVKTPLTAMVFGSAVPKSIDSMANGFIESIYGVIEDAATGKSAITAAAIIKDINTLLSHGHAPLIGADLTIADLMEGTFTPKQVEGLKNSFRQTLGKAMGSAIKNEFADFIEKRKTFNQAAQMAFELHNAVYTALRDQLIAELVKKGELPTRTTKKGEVLPLHDLTPAQEVELRKRLVKLTPTLHSKYSQDSGSLAGGVAISKGGRKLSQDDTYAQEVKFAQPVAGANSVNTHGFQQQETNPGVAMLPMAVHSLDSFISHSAAVLGQVLNVHDAHGAGVGTFQKTAQNLNQATWNAVLEYSPAAQMADALSRTMVGLAELLEQDNLETTVHGNLKTAMQRMAEKLELEGPQDVLNLLVQVRELAFRADSMKLQALSKMQSIDQYALEGGQYQVTDADRASAATRLGALSSALSKEEKQALERIGAALQAEPEATATSATKEEIKDIEDPVTKTSPFGALGTPTIASDPQIVEFFRTHKGEASVQNVISMLEARLRSGGAGRHNAFQAQLLRLVTRTVGNMNVRMVYPDTKEESVLAKPVGAARGWFISLGVFDAEIYVLSPDFVNSGLTVETLMHELTHGALSSRIDYELKKEKADPKYRSEALELIQELDELREKAKKQQGTSSRFSAALENVQEFVAWGMTSQEFQREVLNKISMKSRTGGNSLVNGMKAFVQKVVGILFTGSSKTAQEQAVNGMSVLLNNVSGLFNAVAQGEAPDQARLSLSMAAILQDYSTTDIHNALSAGSITPRFDERLRNILGSVVEKLHGPYGAFKAQLMKQQAITPMDVWLKALATNAAPFASSVQGSPFVVSEREAHAMDQVEATVRAALEEKVVTTKTVYKELERLYREVHAKLTPADFNNQAEYDFLFKIESNGAGRSDHLARFAAFALANEQVAGKLGFTTDVFAREYKGRTFAERVQMLFEQILEYFQESLTDTFGGQRADVKVAVLVMQLVDIEAKRRRNLAAPLNALEQVTQPVGEALKIAGDKVKAAAIQAADSQFVRNNKSAIVRAAGRVTRLYINDQIDLLMQNIVEFRDKHSATFGEQHGLAMQLLTEFKGPGQMLNALQLASTNQQRIRKSLISNTGNFTLQAFEKDGAGLTKQHKAAITSVFLRTGMHALVGVKTMTELEQLLGSEPARHAAIADVEQQLNGFGRFKDHFIHQANALAYFRVTGKVRSPKLMMNAHNIARLYGTSYVGKITEQQAQQAEAVIEQLVALYALGYTDRTVLGFAKETLRSENRRTDGGGNGVEFVLALHKRLEQDSKAQLFAGQEALRMHGYTPEIYNPHTRVETANAVHGRNLELMGYTKVSEVEHDPADPDTDPKALYVLKDGGLQPYLTGVMSFTGKAAKGTRKHSGFMNVYTADGLENASLQADIDAAKPTGLPSGPRRDLSQPGRTFMAPVVNPQGQIVNWRYMMHESSKDSVLERDNRFERVLGSLAGSIYDKQSSTEINTKTLQALKDHYDSEKGRVPDSYVQIGPRSSDPELLQVWQMLPDDTQAAARTVFGRDGIMVRKDQLTMLFGYRKYSLAEAFAKDPLRTGEHIEKMFVGVINHILVMYARVNKGMNQADAESYAKRAAVIVSKGERMWQELVHEVKDILVVKSGVVMMGNMWSNLSLLMIQGVPIGDIVRSQLVAMRAARDYQLSAVELATLQAKIDTGTAGMQEPVIKREIIRLQDAIARNPVKHLIDAGMMPTIVEDVAQDDDPYSYKSALVRRTEKFTDQLHPGVVSLAKGVYMSHDTKIYQSLSRMTQLSDFVARYTLYQHLTTRKTDPMSHADAIHEASEAFINYDIPMPKGMQYMDDVGITMFTKYFLRIQRVLARMVKDHSGRMLMTVALQQFLDLGSIVLEGSWMHKFGNNPIYSGALQLPGTLDELGTVHAGMSLLGNVRYPGQ